MKHLIIILISIFSYNLAMADLYEIEAGGKILSYSQIAQPGKISIFILSTDWCAPCKVLKAKLEDESLDMKIVDLYFVNTSKGMNYKEFVNTSAFKYTNTIEGVKGWPTVFIAAQSTNVVSSFSVEEFDPFERIKRAISNLIKDGGDFDASILLTEFQHKATKLNKASEKTYTIRIGYFENVKPNLEVYDDIQKMLIINPDGKNTVVSYGSFINKKEANESLKYLKELGYSDAYIDTNNNAIPR